ncbi:MAG: hypothetical protein VKJ24_08735 [Synechococcales bacterium]|nr:hypothetical protein [Synechococcales bacterium]
MPLSLHNFTWEEVRLVQVETQPHHIAGVLATIQQPLQDSDSDWEDIFSAYYDCEEDGTTTFYEAESAEAGNPGIWTYVIYNCEPGEETVVTNLAINPSDPALCLQNLLVEVVAASALENPAEKVQRLETIASTHEVAIETLLAISQTILPDHSPPSFEAAASYVLQKNAELYRRLA